MYRSFFLVAFFQGVISTSSGPAPTEHRLLSHEEMAMVGMSPAPTPAPKRRNAKKLLDRRQEDTVDDETCAYFGGDYNEPLNCDAGTTCLFNTASDWFGCCEDEYTCSSINTWCVPSTGVTDLFESSNTLYCTEGTATECSTIENIWSMIGTTFTKYACGDSDFSATVYFEATNAPDSTPVDPATPIISSSGDSITTPDPTTYTPYPPSPKKPTPIGPIVGGVVGGIVVLSIIVVGVFLLLRRKKKAASNSVHYSQPQPMGGHTHMPPSMAPPMGHYPPQNGADTKYPEAIVSPTSPASPTPPYYPPYSPPPQIAYHVHQPEVSQLP